MSQKYSHDSQPPGNSRYIHLSDSSYQESKNITQSSEETYKIGKHDINVWWMKRVIEEIMFKLRNESRL